MAWHGMTPFGLAWYEAGRLDLPNLVGQPASLGPDSTMDLELELELDWAMAMAMACLQAR